MRLKTTQKIILMLICQLLAACSPFHTTMQDYAQEQHLKPVEDYKEFEDYENEENNDGVDETNEIPHSHSAAPENNQSTPNNTPSAPPENKQTTDPENTSTTPAEGKRTIAPENNEPTAPSRPRANQQTELPPSQQSQESKGPQQRSPQMPRPVQSPAPSSQQKSPPPERTRVAEETSPKDPHPVPQKTGCESSGTSPCFPVAGEAQVHNDFGASRGNGTRRHAGNDVMAAKLTPVIAIDDGVVETLRLNSGSAGTYLAITHAKGLRSVYMHLNNDTPGTDDGQGEGIPPGIKVGTAVKKGQLIGWVGDSGNAEFTSPHLHFELQVLAQKTNVRRSGYYPIDPNPMLKGSESFNVLWSRGYRYGVSETR